MKCYNTRFRPGPSVQFNLVTSVHLIRRRTFRSFNLVTMSKLTKVRLALVGFALILFLIFQVVELGFSGALENAQFYVYILAGISSIIGVQFLWRLIFCQGRSFGLGRKFELTGFAEGVLHTFNFVLIGGIGYSLWVSPMAWYEYILPVLMCLLPLASSLNYYVNRNDAITLCPGELHYVNNNESGAFKYNSYSFYRAESNALSSSFTKTDSWHLSFKNEKEKAIKFDLKDMNLAGHKNAMEKYLKSIGAVEQR